MIRIAILLLLQLVFALAAPLAAQESTVTEAPAKVQQLIELLDDPEVRQWLIARQPGTQSVAAPSSAVASRWTAAIRGHLNRLRDAVPRLVPEWRAAGERVASELQNQGRLPILRGFAFVLLLGYGAEFLLGYALKRIARRNAAESGQGLAALLRIAPLVVFAITAIAAFVLAHWPKLLEAAVAPLLIAWIVARFLIAVASVVLKPAYDGTDVAEASLNPEIARFWHRRLVLLICALTLLWAINDMAQALLISGDVRDLVAAGFGLVILGFAVDTILRRPVPAIAPGHQILRNALVVAFLILMWLVWVAGMKLLFWLGVYALALRPLLRFTTAATRSMQDSEAANHVRVVRNVLIDRGARFAVIALAAAWLAVVLQFNGNALIQDDVFNRLFRGILAGVVILLAADLIWQLAKELISLHLKRAAVDVTNSAEIAHNMRLRTLLPILRNFLATFITVVAIMMVLASLGIEIGPLIASAGVFGVAIGFGSQTLVKDIISGIFYMMDDAFRVGEYIQSGSYKGTVESFNIRSVKLRHHRGPVFTVPFGSLGAVQNMSRDWGIDKFMISVAYDSDLAAIKKVVKGVGTALLDDPELGPLILETVKMKGIEQFGDYGITLSFGMKTKPGGLTQVRRRAQALILDAFAANGINFASPTVQVAGDDKQAMAAAAANRDAIARKNATVAQGEEPVAD